MQHFAQPVSNSGRNGSGNCFYTRGVGCSQFLLDSLDRSHADAEMGSNFPNPEAFLPERFGNSRLFFGANPGTAKPLPLGLGSTKSNYHTLSDNCPFQFRENPAHCKHGAARRASGINTLLLQKQVDVQRLKIGYESEEVFEITRKPVDAPRSHEIELPPGSGRAQCLKRWTCLSPFCAREAGVRIDLDDLPARPVSDRPKFPFLIFHRLAGGGDPNVNRDTFRHVILSELAFLPYGGNEAILGSCISYS
jgi:hypothetical protein